MFRIFKKIKRYSRNFRIFAGIVAFFAGIINFGIFPAVGAQFFINYCGLPESFLGIPMYPLVMILLLGVALYFVYTGGQIAVIIADFFQGVFVTLVLFGIALFLICSLIVSGFFSASFRKQCQTNHRQSLQ